MSLSKYTLFFLLTFFMSTISFSQDWSLYGKKIKYSKEYALAKDIKDIDFALKNPKSVYSLHLILDEKGANYDKFKANYKNFTSLRKLVIDNKWSECKKEMINDFSVFKNLEYLRIECFNKPDLNGLDSLYSLKYLSLIICRFDSIPPQVLALKNIEVLDLSINNLTKLSRKISALKRVKELDLSNNCFSAVPLEIAALDSIIYFDINNAELEKRLKDGTLICKNKITQYPSVFINMPILKKVSFYKVDMDISFQEKLKTEFPKVKFSF